MAEVASKTFSKDLRAAADVLRTRIGINRDEAYTHLIVGIRELERLGWKIVGPEPTDAMEKAGYGVLCSDDAPSIDSPQHWESYISPKIWKAQFVASPSVDELLEGEK